MKKLALIILLLGSHIVSGQSCSDIKTVSDSFFNVNTHTSPVLTSDAQVDDDKTTFKVFAVKQTFELEPEYSLMFTLTTPFIDFEGHGVIILLEDGSKIEKPQLKMLFEGGSEETVCKYSIKMVIEKEELDLLLKNGITNLRFFAFDSEHPVLFNIGDQPDSPGTKLLFYLNCLRNK